MKRISTKNKNTRITMLITSIIFAVLMLCNNGTLRAQCEITACPTDTIVVADDGMCEASGLTTDHPMVDATSCSGTTELQLTINFADGTTMAVGVVTPGNTYTIPDLPVGVNVFNYQLSDDNGIQGECIYEITVVDEEAPMITCPGDIVVMNEMGMCGDVRVL